MSKYLNLDGLGTFWDKIKSTFVKKNDNGYIANNQIPVKTYRAGGSRAYVRICRCKAPTTSTSPTIDCNIRMGDATVRVIIQGYNGWRANVIGYLNSASFKFYAHQVVVEEETFYDIIAYHTTYCRGFYSSQFLYDYDVVDFSYWAAPYTEYTPTSEEEIPYIMLAKSTASSSNAPVKVNGYGDLSPITVDDTPTAGHTANLVSSDGVAAALAGGTAKAASADKLTTARKLAVSLSNTSTDTTFDGSANVTNLKVSGILSVNNGGTGKNSVTANSYLKGNGTGALTERTYAEVRTDLGISAGANKVEASTTNGNIKIDGTEKTVYSHPAGSAASKTGVPTANASPAFGGTFKVNQIATDSTSHVKSITERTITIPNTTGNASTAGLTKLYTETGTNTDGTMTQSAIKTELDEKKNFKYAKVYASTAYNASSARYFLLAEKEKTYTSNWQDTSEFKLTAYPGSVPKYMVFRLNFNGSKNTCNTPKVYELYSGNLSSEERKVIEVRYTTSATSSSITVHIYIYIDRNYLQTGYTSFHLEPMSIGIGDRSNTIDNGLTSWSYKTAETYVTSLSGTTVAHSSESVLVDISGNAATADTATNADITRTANTTDGDKLQIGNGTSVNIVNAKHAASADKIATSDKKIGDTNKPVYIAADGTVTAGSTYAAGTAVTLNGTSKSASTASFYAPTGAGSSGQLLKSSGSGAPTWATANAALVGITVTSTSVSDGINICTNTDTKVTQTKDDSGTTEYPLLMAGATNPNGSATTARYDSGVKLNPSTNTITANISGTAATATNANNVNVQKDTTTKLFLTGVDGDPGTSGSNKALKTDTGIYADTTAGKLVAKEFNVNGSCTLQYNSTTKSLDFVFA